MGDTRDFRPFWTADKVVILATFGEGPHTGTQVACATPRVSLRGHVRRAKNRQSWRDPHFMHSLSSAILSQVHRGVAQLMSATDKDFMGDLAILMGVKFAGGGEEVLAGAGLFSILLAVSEDATLPWDQRGFLTATDQHSAIAEMG